MDFFQKSMRKCRKSKDTKGTKKDTKDKEKDKSGSKKTAKKKKEAKEVKDVAKSSRSMRKTKIKKKEKKSTDSKSEVEIFDPNTFSFKIDTSLVPEAENHTAPQTAAFETFATSIVTPGVDGLIKEYFEQIISFIPAAYVERTIFDQNTPLKKNRYKDVVCNDKTRVILRDGRPGDYIHANYVKGTKFILTQGPLKDTMIDFWRMAIQEGASAICMLCELVENGKTKCEAYFPDGTGQSLTFGDIVVTCDDATQQDTHTQVKTLSVSDKKIGKTLKVMHYKIITWPDKTVASSNLSILRTHRLLRRLPGPSIIHCSAGVGRTGTFAAIEIGVQCLLNGKTFQPSELVKALRHCRLVSVQMDTQYLMMAETILDCGVSFKYIEDSKLVTSIESFKEHVAEYVKAHPPPAEKAPTVTVTAEKPTEEIPQQNPRQSGSGRSPRRSKEKAGTPVNQPIPQSPRGSKERAWRSEKAPNTPVAPPAPPAATPPAPPPPPPPVTPPAPVPPVAVPPVPVPAVPVVPAVPAVTPPPPQPPVTPVTPVPPVVPPPPAVTSPKPVTLPTPVIQPGLVAVPSKPHLTLTPPPPAAALPKLPITPTPAAQPPVPAAPPAMPPKPSITPMATPVVSPVAVPPPKPAITPVINPVVPKPTTPPVPTPTTPPVATPPPMSNPATPNKPAGNPSAAAKSQYIV